MTEKETTNSITRGVGYVVDGGYIVGGGYEGLTKELDALVQKCAEWLHSHFPDRDVQIRFNSNRKSGGAFIESNHGLSGVIYIKFGAGLRASGLQAALNRYTAGEITFSEYENAIRNAEDDMVYVDVGVNLKHTKNTCAGTPEFGDVLWVDFDTFDEAARYIEENVQEITGVVDP